jgi:hypothetical protein
MKRLLLPCIFQIFICALYAQPSNNISPQGGTLNSSHAGFIENKGQLFDQNLKPVPEIKYLYHSPGFNVQIRQTGFSYDTYTDSVAPKDVQKIKESLLSVNENNYKHQPSPVHNIFFHRVDIELTGCNANAQLIAEGKSADYDNYYTQNVEKDGALDVHHYQKIVYKKFIPI